jgi:AcrR family transcriptional regulator
LKAGVRVRKRASKTKSGRPPAAEAELRAAHLRDIAAEVFLEFGYEATSLGEIAKRAGASKETLYAHYADKADLFCPSAIRVLNGGTTLARR